MNRREREELNRQKARNFKLNAKEQKIVNAEKQRLSQFIHLDKELPDQVFTDKYKYFLTCEDVAIDSENSFNGIKQYLFDKNINNIKISVLQPNPNSFYFHYSKLPFMEIPLTISTESYFTIFLDDPNDNFINEMTTVYTTRVLYSNSEDFFIYTDRRRFEVTIAAFISKAEKEKFLSYMNGMDWTSMAKSLNELYILNLLPLSRKKLFLKNYDDSQMVINRREREELNRQKARNFKLNAKEQKIVNAEKQRLSQFIHLDKELPDQVFTDKYKYFLTCADVAIDSENSFNGVKQYLFDKNINNIKISVLQPNPNSFYFHFSKLPFMEIPLTISTESYFPISLDDPDYDFIDEIATLYTTRVLYSNSEDFFIYTNRRFEVTIAAFISKAEKEKFLSYMNGMDWTSMAKSLNELYILKFLPLSKKKLFLKNYDDSH